MKILKLGNLKNSRIKSISIIKNGLGLLPKESKDLLNKLLDDKFDDIYLEDYHIEIIDKIFDYVDFEYDCGIEEGNSMDLGSSKYGMIEYQENLEKAQTWYDKLSDEEKEYINILNPPLIAFA